MIRRPLNECNILYVEDDPPSRKVMSLILTKSAGVANHAVFENSENFLSRLNALAFTPDIFLLDIHLAPLDGFAILQVLRASAEYRSRKVIALTASVMNEEVQRLRAAGFDGAISKPVDHRQIPILLERVFNGESVWSIS